MSDPLFLEPRIFEKLVNAGFVKDLGDEFQLTDDGADACAALVSAVGTCAMNAGMKQLDEACKIVYLSLTVDDDLQVVASEFLDALIAAVARKRSAENN